MHRYAQQFFLTGHLQHGKNSWPERPNWEVVEQIRSALSEAKCKPETWTLRTTTVSALMKTVWCSFATFSREIHYYVNDWGGGVALAVLDRAALTRLALNSQEPSASAGIKGLTVSELF